MLLTAMSAWEMFQEQKQQRKTFQNNNNGTMTVIDSEWSHIMRMLTPLGYSRAVVELNVLSV